MAVCDAGTCRAATCQRYGAVSGSVAITQPVEISGNCPCSGAEQLAWTTPGAESPPRVDHLMARDGRISSFAYDTRGRLIASCVGDTDHVVTTSPSSCPASGVWSSREYDATWPALVRYERSRSRVNASASATTEIERVYDTTYPLLRFVHQRGYRPSVPTTLVTETTEYVYDTQGRLSEARGPAGELTTYTYWPSGSGNATGLLRYRDDYTAASAYLRTSHGAYTRLGYPTSVTEPSGLVRGYGYALGGMRLTSMTMAGRTTTLGYDAAGRLQSVTEPSGRYLSYTYDTLGRLWREEARESVSSSVAERTERLYDASGRRTSVELRRVTGGTPGSAILTASAAYDTHGYQSSGSLGAQSPVTYTRDPAAMGYLASLTRGDGDSETYGRDALGRMTQITRTFASGASSTHSLSYTNASTSGFNTGDSRPTRVTAPGGGTWDFRYDDFGHLAVSSAAGWGVESWTWTNGRLTSVAHSDGSRTDYSHDRLGRVTYVDQHAESPLLIGQDYQYVYDDGVNPGCYLSTGCTYRLGRLARVGVEHSPGALWNIDFDYAADGRLVAERSPETWETRYTYDAQGRLERTYFPARPSDAVRNYYDTTTGDGHDPSEVTRIVHERAGATWLEWARDIDRDAAGRATRIVPHDNPTLGHQITWRSDGGLSCMMMRRRGGSGSVGVVDRCYGYSADGSGAQHDSIVSGDSARTYFYDGGNRLTCAASAYAASSCPTGSTLVERFTYDGVDHRQTAQSPGGTTSYLLNGPALWDEYPPSRLLYYQYGLPGNGGPRDWDREVTSGSPLNQRDYVYDGQGRLVTVGLYRPGSTPGSAQQAHSLLITYDHRSRPMEVLDVNWVTGVEEQWRYFWDVEDRLINRVHLGNLADPTRVEIDSFVEIDEHLVGRIRAAQVGSTVTEEQMYYVLAPEGLPAAAYTFDRTTLATSQVWRGQWGPFGTLLSQVTSDVERYAPPFRFRGQIELPRSNALWWNGSSLFESRASLVLNGWRTYDPRVGQYLQPEPLMREGLFLPANVYAYAFSAPVDYVDRDGRIPDTFRLRPDIGAA
ncbi:MAG: hypothetical protein K8H88_13510, partial [Sandaracinaceae bacterium]|nr:hypothetical protein [Sandaracinaceae bacterium]